MSVIENQTGGKLVYLPYLITQKQKEDQSDIHTEQNVKLPDVINEEQPPVKEKHHKDKSKCTICIRKRAQRKLDKEEKEKKKL